MMLADFADFKLKSSRKKDSRNLDRIMDARAMVTFTANVDFKKDVSRYL